MDKDRTPPSLWDILTFLVGTVVIGGVSIYFNTAIEGQKNEIESQKNEIQALAVRTQHSADLVETFIDGRIDAKIEMADFMKRFAPEEEQRTLWEAFHGELLKRARENPGQLQEKYDEIAKKANLLAEIKDSSSKEAAELKTSVKQLSVQANLLETQLRGVREQSARTSDAEVHPAGQVDMPRGIRNNNPVNVDRSPWVGSMPMELMTPVQRAERQFAVFTHPRFGYRAGGKVLLNSQRKSDSNLSTFEHLHPWLSSNEHARRKLATQIEKELGLKIDEQVDVTKDRFAFVFLDELTVLMNRQSPYPEFIEEGLDLLDDYKNRVHTQPSAPK